MTNQPTITLNDGRTMPQIGLGVFKVPPPDAARLVKTAVGLGYRAVDTAAFYENEEGVGEGLRAAGEAGEACFVTTKLWRDQLGYDSALRAFDRSFAALGRPQLDLYLIHWPNAALDLYVESWRALIRLRDEGRVASIGVSNFQIAHLERLIGETGVVPVTNQIELHPRLQQHALQEFHRANGIATTGWSPLGRGASLDDPIVAAIAKRHGRTPAQTILRWHLEQGLIVIPKASSAPRLAENLAITDFRLDADDMAAFAELDANGRIGPDPDQF